MQSGSFAKADVEYSSPRWISRVRPGAARRKWPGRPNAAFPSDNFANLSNSLILESCSHNTRSKLESVDKFCVYTGATSVVCASRHENNEPPIVGVVAVDGADDLRLFALTYDDIWWFGLDNQKMVIRKRACLECCLNVCRKADAYVLIL